MTGGGASVADVTSGFVDQDYPNGKTGWSALLGDLGAAPTTTGTIYAICAVAAATAP